MAKPKKKFDTAGESPDNVKQMGKKKKFHPHNLINLTPKNERQKSFLHAFHSNIPLIIQDGFAGTGKTYLAIHTALREVFDESTPYDELIVFRSAVQERKIGFLTGDEDEKGSVFESPYQSIIDELIEPYQHSYDNLKALGKYRFMLTSHQRGNTYNNCIMVIDEAQNMDASEIRTIITRAGYNCRIIICGDLKQDDLIRQKEKSGFSYLNKVVKMMPSDMSTTITYKLDDIVRSGLVKEFLIADSKIDE
tara:strand:+ start:821 stop:1570 length:750 start_codon:yes stop_codon:yes gene_type:complete